MRILHIIGTLDRQAGGPSNSVRRILSAYQQIGSEGEVVTLDDPSASFLKDIGFTMHALGPVSTRYGFNPRLIPWLRSERHRFDGVVLHGLWQYLGYAVRRAIFPHKPYVVFTHGMLDPYFKRSFPLKHLKKVPYWLINEYWVLCRAQNVLFTSAAEARLATQSFWPNTWNSRVVPYGANPPADGAEALRAGFLARNPALLQPDGRSRPFILFLGRIDPKKGCDLLLDAFAQVARDAPHLHLVFAGPDPAGLVARLRASAAAAEVGHRIHWPGMLYGDDKWGAFYSCEAFSLPSHQENFGIAVAEALACGKPVLISDKVNIWEDVAADGAALVGPDDASGTLATLRRWITLCPSEKLRMGERAAACFLRRYDMNANASGIIESFADAQPSGSLANAGPAKSKISAHKPV